MSFIPIIRSALLLAPILLLAACGKSADTAKQDGKEKSAAPAASLAVSMVRAEMGQIERSVAASGAIMPWEEMQLGVELSGVRVTALHVDVGQSVVKDQILLELDHRMIDSELRQAQAAYAEADSGVKLAKLNLARGETMGKDHLISASALDELRAVLVQAEARQATTRAQRDGVQLRRDFATLRAPDAGVIFKRMVQPGQVVMAGSELMRMIRQGRLEWRAELAEADLMRVQPGALVQLVDGNGKPVEGHIRAVTPGVDSSTRTGTVFADLPDPGALKMGVFAEGRIVLGSASALLLPAATIVRRDGYAYVFKVSDQGLASRVRVSIGTNDGDRVEVLDGIKVGDAVVERGVGFLGDGDRVRVVAATNPTPAATVTGAAQ